MIAKSIINCTCEIHFDSLAEYQALDEVYQMVDKKNPMGDDENFIIKEIVTSSFDGCSITYPKKESEKAK